MITRLITWMNENEGFLMVIITIIYVVATVFICVYNGINAKASRDQITTSQKQQEQNTGLQLYSMRSSIINSIWNRQYTEVFWDVHMLFDKKISDKFDTIFQKNQKLTKLRREQKDFEDKLESLVPKQQKYSFITQIANAKDNKDYADVERLLEMTLVGISDGMEEYYSIEDYINNLKMVDETQKTIDDMVLQLTLGMREYTRKSIRMS